jgi:hypothetical protein
MENIPKITKNKRTPFEAIYAKYVYGRYKKGIESLLNTQASIPNEQGIKVIISNKINYIPKPNIP